MDVAVIEVLQQASSQDPRILKPAEQTLKQWETERGFYTALYNVFSDHSLPTNVRWMAVLYFKNGVDRYWRKTAPNAIAEDEKEFLRQRLIASFDEPVNQLAVQIAILISRIARLDWPREWSTLIPTLLEVIRGQNSFAQHRAMLTLHHVVKTLASKRLIGDQRLFQELTANIFNFVLNLWNTFTESFLILASNSADAREIQEAMEKALLLLRILRNLIVNGFREPSKSPDAMLLLKTVFERARTSLECRKTLMSRGIQIEVCEKFIIHLTKVLLGVLQLRRRCFIELVPISLEFTVFYCFTEAGRPLTFERFVIQCMNLLKGIWTIWIFEDECIRTGRELIHPAAPIRHDFFTDEIQTEICSRLVTHYFLLTPADLELWDTDPENFAVADVEESWKYCLRPSTESLFLALLSTFDNIPCAVLVDLIRRHHQPVDPNDLHAILLKDAVYNAVGLAASSLYDQVDFDQWFSTTLQQELKLRGTNYRIIRRRVCWLIGRWAGIKMSPKLRPELYKLMVESLSPEEDLCVRLAASDALRSVIDDFAFNAEEFSPFLERALAMLFALLKEVNQCDTKMRVLFVLSFMIERTDFGIKAHINSFIAYLPDLWQQSKEHNMLRCAIVSTLVHLEKALGSESVKLEPLVVEVVAVSCDVNQDGHVYLLEDGLELWLALLENVPAPTPAIMDLYRNMPALLDSSTENLWLCLYIIQAYVLLSPLEFLSEHGTMVVHTIKSLIGDMRSEGKVVAMRLFETCLNALPLQGAQLIKPLLGRIFDTVYKGTEQKTMVMTMYLSIVARVLLGSKDIFAQAVSELARESGDDATEESVLARIIEVWLHRMAVVAYPDRLKLLSLALCSFLTLNSPLTVINLFPNIISSIVETLNDITEDGDVGCSIDSLLLSDQPSTSQYEDVDYETEHGQRRKKLAANDPVHSVSLRDTLQNQLIPLRRMMGDCRFEQMLQGLSENVNKQLKRYIRL